MLGFIVGGGKDGNLFLADNFCIFVNKIIRWL
jgi:hypothetical protein